MRNLFRVSRTVPTTAWTASHRWEFAPRRFLVLIFGLFIFGLGDSLLIHSGLGNAPWSVLAQGVALKLDLSIGTATFLISTLVLMIWLPLRERPGLGTLTNIVVIAIGIDVGLLVFAGPDLLALRLLYVFLGIALVGIGSALYITCGLGSGPRDGLMTALHNRTGVRVARVRLAIEFLVLALGALLGGTLGIGTALFALLIGHSVAIAFGVVARTTSQ